MVTGKNRQGDTVFKYTKEESMSILDAEVRHYGTTGRGISARENVVIKTTKALHLLSATAWAGGAFSMQALGRVDKIKNQPI